MQDTECIELLQWMLPRLGLRWAGFRRVRKQVCKRVSRRLRELGLEDMASYRQYLCTHAEEWPILDSLCTVTISRFFRGRADFSFLGSDILPALRAQKHGLGSTALAAWSAGCASGEEAYTLILVWNFLVAHRVPDVRFRVLGTDVDQVLLSRARRACYPSGSLRGLPKQWQEKAFEQVDSGFCLKSAYKNQAAFELHDIRSKPPRGEFDLVLCRNLAFTYFDKENQLATAQRLLSSLREGGALVLGSHEQLPAEARGFSVWSEAHRVYRKGS